MRDLLSRWRPLIHVFAQHDELQFVGKSTFNVAPVVWFNAGGQVAAFGAKQWSDDQLLRPVDLQSEDACLDLRDHRARAAELFLRYAFELVRPRAWIRLAPDIVFVDCVAPREDGAKIRRRAETFRRAALLAGARRVEFGAPAV